MENKTAQAFKMWTLKNWPYVLGIAVVGFVCVAGYLLVWWPRRLPNVGVGFTAMEQFSMVNERRKTAAQIVTGVFAALAALATGWNTLIAQGNYKQNKRVTDKTLEVTEAKQASERFVKATENLESEKLSTRVGAIYSLERIAKSVSPKKYQSSTA